MFSIYDVVICMDGGDVATFTSTEEPVVVWFDEYVRVSSPLRTVEVSRLTIQYVSVTERQVSARDVVEGRAR